MAKACSVAIERNGNQNGEQNSESYRLIVRMKDTKRRNKKDYKLSSGYFYTSYSEAETDKSLMFWFCDKQSTDSEAPKKPDWDWKKTKLSGEEYETIQEFLVQNPYDPKNKVHTSILLVFLIIFALFIIAIYIAIE